MHDILTSMYKRCLKSPNHSFFLFGPRATGKTTWLRENFPNGLWKNLLLDEDYLPLLADTSLLKAEVEARDEGDWIIIDEIQRIPSLLNQIHDLISRFGDRYKFAMSGSSARKLRRLNANLLAGRALDLRFFPLTSIELGNDFNLSKILAYGALPPVVQKPEHQIGILTSYVGTYLKQEIQQEALVEDIGSFHRFLSVAGIMNGECINISSVARDASVSRSTVQRYFEILVDTLIGFRLPGWQPRLKVREKVAPKFYLFDTGIVRTLTQRIRDPLSNLETGKLLETFILHELRSAISFLDCGGELFYWRTSAGVEVDFIWSRGDKTIAIEVKSSTTWRRENSKALKDLLHSKKINAAYGIYQGKNPIKDEGVLVLPINDFLKKLYANEILN